MNNNSGATKPSHFYLWLIILFIIVVVGTLVLFAVKKGVPGINMGFNDGVVLSKPPQEFGFFLTRGQLESWESKDGLIKLTIEDSDGYYNNFKILAKDDLKVYRLIGKDQEQSPNYNKLEIGNISEIGEGVVLELYSQKSSLSDFTPEIKTIIYWK